MEKKNQLRRKTYWEKKKTIGKKRTQWNKKPNGKTI